MPTSNNSDSQTYPLQILGDPRWGGQFGIDADVVALQDSQVLIPGPDEVFMKQVGL